jgi:glycosyltransferase involved in cell wall biosynthesis
VKKNGILKLAIVTNIPAPYRLPVYEALAADSQIELKVFFCSGREPDREWDLRDANFEQVFLRERFISFRGRFIHFNFDVWSALRAYSPDVVVTTGFNPTHLLAYMYTRRYGAKHVVMTDGTFDSEQLYSKFHRWIRRKVYAKTQTFIGASKGSLDLYRSYKIDERRLFKSHLCANNTAFRIASTQTKNYDFIFCGRFIALKNPLFALQVAQQVSRQLCRKISIIFVGAGEMASEIRAMAATMSADVEVTFPGFARQDELPHLYGSSRIFMFPTQWDPWGVVANEACAAGLPVLVTPDAGSAGELIHDGENGFVLPLNLTRWVDAAVTLLTNEDLYKKFSKRSLELVSEYTYENAALGIRDAAQGAAGLKQCPQVVIVQRRLTHYRIPLFEALRSKLAQSGIELVLVYGDATKEEVKKNDAGSLEWGQYQRCHYWISGSLCWQNPTGLVRDASLIIVAQENKLLYNYRLLFSKRDFKLAFWGHGANLQATNQYGLLEWWKAWTTTHVDWWFAYSGLSERLIKKHGFEARCITNLENTIDTKSLEAFVEGVTREETNKLRAELNIGNGFVGVYIGSLYKEKRIDFLLKAAQRISESLPDFHMLVIGDGSERSQIKELRKNSKWLHYLGSKHGRDKAMYLSLADVFLSPGMVGLSVLDAFVAGLPLVTTDCGIHSPEIDYLISGENGLITINTLDDYVTGVTGLLCDPTRLKKLSHGAKQSAKHYSIENMANNFHSGILQALDKPCVS